MIPTKLFSPMTLITHLLLMAFVILYVRLFGPPQSPKIPIPKRALEESPVSEEPSEGAGGDQVDHELLLSEVRPGAMSHDFIKRDDKYWGTLENGWRAELTLDPLVQRVTEHHFEKSRSSMGALALVEVSTGKVRGLYSYVNPKHPLTRKLKPDPKIPLALQAVAPSCGNFRIVTATALLESGYSPLRRASYTKFKGNRLTAYHLRNADPNASNNLNNAIATTDNAYLAQMSYSALSPEQLRQTAFDLGFDRSFSYFGLPYELSAAHIPNDPLQRAKTAVGFKNSRMNVLHAAMLMSAIARDGVLSSPRLVERIIDQSGREISAPELSPMAKGMSRSSAARLRRMMKEAIHESPTGHVFQKWPAQLRHARVAGQASRKTQHKPYFMRHTWFVGYVPAQDPQWAVAVMVINHQKWHVRALDVAHRVLREVLLKLHKQTQE